jgi:hypothetical protein
MYDGAPFHASYIGALKNETSQHYEIEYRTGNETEDLVLYTTTSHLTRKKMTAIFEEGFEEEYLPIQKKKKKKRGCGKNVPGEAAQ